jgi:hypothetical protein
MRASSILNLISCGSILPIAFIAVIFAAAVGGTSFAVATDFNLQLMEGLVCPDESQLTYRLGAYETVDDFPSASNPLGSTSSGRAFYASCVQDGEVLRSGNGFVAQTLLTLLSVYFLVCFLPLLFLSGALFSLLRRGFGSQPDAE